MPSSRRPSGTLKAAETEGGQGALALARMKPLILERAIAYVGYLTVERLRLRLADGAVVWRELERHGDAAVVLPYDPDRRCALIVHLLRAPMLAAAGETVSEEACAGMIEHEEASAAARREAYDELGVELSALEFIGRVWSSPGVSTERQSLFLAPYRLRDRTGKGGGVRGEHEDITVIERSLAGLAADADQARIADAKLLILAQTLRLRRPELFASGARGRRQSNRPAIVPQTRAPDEAERRTTSPSKARPGPGGAGA